MANPLPSSHFNEPLRQEEEEEEAQQPEDETAANAQLLDEEDDSEYDDDETSDYVEEDDGEEDGGGRELILVAESPPRVSDFVQRSVGDGEKRRRVERGGESCSLSGECSQGSQWNRSEIDGLFCPICMDVWTNNGDHHISCLPCGHIYGFACIKRWLQQGRSSGKCPQCNRKCSLKDVRKLFASRIVAIDEESQKRMRSLEAKCASLEKKGAKKEAEWQKREAELNHKVQQLEQRTVFLEHLLGDRKSRQSGFVADVGGFHRQSVFGPNFGSNFRREGSSIVVLQEELPVNGARLFDVDASSQILLMARKLPGIAGTHLLTKISLIHPHEIEDILLPSGTKAIKDLHFSPFNHSLALFASLDKKLSVLSMESNNVILDYDLPAAAWSCSWDYNSAHYIYAGLQNGLLLVFDMRQTTRPVESLKGPTCNPIHTIHPLLHDSTFPSGVRTLLSASSVGVCHWDFVGTEVRSYMVPETENRGVCISLAYSPSSDDIVASFRPRVETSNEIAISQPVVTPSPITGQGIPGSRVLLKKEGINHYQKLGSSITMVNDIRLPKSTIIDMGNQKQLFASAEEVSNELILHELPSFSSVQYLESRNHQHPFRDVKYTNVNSQASDIIRFLN
ncbi:hypothetical protein LWI29_000351 [Acer saccharum]|uniref:RING-type E3 ubiquitin transferase n=1 Tax=Acer saccharum TaxID=4024 RepID=A0AA39RXK6_ACESA|nr:hypothetical protein LWI29_000351 [Acer saccharum]